MSNFLVTKTYYESYIQYLIWQPEDIKKSDGLLHGHGLEIIIEFPKNEYILPTDFPVGGWDKVINLPIIETLYGQKMGAVDNYNGTMPMFSIVYTPPICNNIHSSKRFIYHINSLLGIIFADTTTKFRDNVRAGNSMSTYGKKVTDRLNLYSYLIPPQKTVPNDYDKYQDTEFHPVSTDPQKMIIIPDSDYRIGRAIYKYIFKSFRHAENKETNIQLELFEV